MSSATLNEENAPPALFDHCVNVYRAMLSEAKTVVDVAESSGDESSQHIVIYEGFLTQLITSKLNLSVPYYTSIRKALVRMGCVRQLRRGGGTSPSQWEMIYEPTIEAFFKAQPTKVPAQTKESQVQEQLDNLRNRVEDLEEFQTEVIRVLQEQFGSEEA